MRKIYVQIPKRVGDYKVDTGGKSFVQVTAAGTGLGASLGSIIPGLGNAIGAGIGTIGAGVAALFGFGSGRDEVRDVFRKIVGNAFGSILPGRIRFIGSARDVVELEDQFVEADIRAVFRELQRATLEALEPGTDLYSDLSLAFRSLEFNTFDSSSSYDVLVFQATTAADGSPASPHEPDTLTPAGKNAQDGKQANDNADVSTTGGADSALLSIPVLAGVGILLFLLISR